MTDKLIRPLEIELPEGKWKHKITRQLHERKWIYRVTFAIPDGRRLAKYGLRDMRSALRKKVKGAKRIRKHFPEKSAAIVHETNRAFDFIETINGFRTEETLVTYRFGCPALYTSNREILDQVCDVLGKYIVEIAAPVNKEAVQLLDDEENVILCRTVPHGTYHFRVGLDIRSCTRDDRKRFVMLFERTPSSKMQVPEDTEFWARGYKPLCHMYFYVRDIETVNEIRRVMGERVLYVDKYIVHRPSYVHAVDYPVYWDPNK